MRHCNFASTISGKFWARSKSEYKLGWRQSVRSSSSLPKHHKYLHKAMMAKIKKLKATNTVANS